MSHKGMIAAEQYAHDLPAFANRAEAERVLFEQRDTGMLELQSETGSAINLDYSPESLKELERWYFENGQPATTKRGYSMPHSIAFYFGEILCRNANFKWMVQEYSFAKGRYEIGVQRPLLAVMLTKGKEIPATGNKRMQSLWRAFQSYAS